jgi:hydrogenase expression/formation protein HypD
VKFVDEYRDADLSREYARRIERVCTRPWTIMEVCGGQTHSIIRFGVDQLLPPSVVLLHGPGCPVCVTPLELVEKALEIASRPDVIFCSFGDMLRVPGRSRDLLAVKAAGGDVRIVYSPLDALKIALAHPEREVVFFAVGFETTAPANALAVHRAAQEGIENFSVLVSHVRVPPALETILSEPENRVQGFLAAGHVCTVMGYWEYEPIAARWKVPIVVTGFEPVDILQGLYLCISDLEQGRHSVQNQYSRAVRPEGNRVAQRLINDVFRIIPRKWRGIGEIPQSGLGLRDEYSVFDAELRFGVTAHTVDEPPECQSGLVLRGMIKPSDCPSFGTACTPEHPLGATMVSSEGACAAYYRYRVRASKHEGTKP